MRTRPGRGAILPGRDERRERAVGADARRRRLRRVARGERAHAHAEADGPVRLDDVGVVPGGGSGARVSRSRTRSRGAFATLAGRKDGRFGQKRPTTAPSRNVTPSTATQPTRTKNVLTPPRRRAARTALTSSPAPRRRGGPGRSGRRAPPRRRARAART